MKNLASCLFVFFCFHFSLAFIEIGASSFSLKWAALNLRCDWCAAYGIIVCAMNENKALVRVLQQKSHSIPLGVRYWTFYKGTVLEKEAVRERVRGAAVFKEAMKPYMKRSPFRPSRKRSRRTCDILNRDMLNVASEYHKVVMDPEVPWEVCNTDFGLGLYAKRDFEWTATHSKMLFGAVCDISVEDFLKLQEDHYPSLFSSQVTGILFGPASLLNHSCSAQLSWSRPTKRGPPSQSFEGFLCLRVKGRSKKKVKFAKGDPITVKYGMRKKDFTCECESCAAAK